MANYPAPPRSRPSPFFAPQGFSREVLTRALDTAEVWAEHGYSEGSRSYWTGMRDTLRVLLGVTTGSPASSSDDAAATTMFAARNSPAR